MIHKFSRAALVALAFAIAACSSSKDNLPPDNPFKSGKSERELRLEADGLYKLARRSLDSADFQGAVQRYDQILLKYPFTDYATQAQLESVYAKYRAFDAEGALSVADRFLKEHPRHPAVDYVYYLKGLINFQRGESAFDWMVDSTRQDVSFAQQSFDDFGTLVRKYPASRYAGDARERMVYLRNRIAAHELSIVKYYVRRGGYIAAAKRAEKIVADYPGAPVELETLALLEDSYRKVGLDAQADDVKKLRDANKNVVPVAENEPPAKPSFWQRWFGHSEPPPPAPAPAPAPPPEALKIEKDDFTVQAGAVVREISPEQQPAAPQASPVEGKSDQPQKLVPKKPVKKKAVKKKPAPQPDATTDAATPDDAATRPRTAPSADSGDPAQKPAQ